LLLSIDSTARVRPLARAFTFYSSSSVSTGLENINDNLPVEHQLEIIRRWADQMGYQVVAATLQRALDELEARPK
jgi:hypothetical protein